MWENVRILVVAKNRKKNRKNVRTTVARGARMNWIAKNAPKGRLRASVHRTTSAVPPKIQNAVIIGRISDGFPGLSIRVLLCAQKYQSTKERQKVLVFHEEYGSKGEKASGMSLYP